MSRTSTVAQLRCVSCGKTYREGEVDYTCPACGIEGILDVEFDYERVARTLSPATIRERPSSIWRYRELLPVPDGAALPTLQIGMTPVFELPAVARRHGLGGLFIKDDGRLPTGSFKDRASAVGTARAVALGFKEIACSSTGNAASSLAGWSAHWGLRAFIFVPAAAPEAKVTQLRIFGATVLLVDGSYDQAYSLCEQAVKTFGWYNRNCAVNPYLVEGKKTCGLEIGEQLGAQTGMTMPDVVAVSVGDGCTIAGIWKGLGEAKRLGFAERLPRLLGVQAHGANPIAEAFRTNVETIRPRAADTLADSIAVGQPRNYKKALRAIRASGGAVVEVEDAQILEAERELATYGGVFAEPAGVAAFAGLMRARADGLVRPGERVLHAVTGNGLKDLKGAQRAAVVEPHRIPVSLDAVRAVVAGVAARP